MTCVSRVLEWVRALLFRDGAFRKRIRVRMLRTSLQLQQAEQTPVGVTEVPPSPVMMGTLLARARLRRTGRRSEHDQGETHFLVPLYVLPPGERQRVLLARPFTEVVR